VSVKEARIKTNISSQICYRTKLQELSVQLYSFAFVSENNMLRVRRLLFHKFLFVCLLFLPYIDIIMTLLRFCLLHYAWFSLMRVNTFCSLQQRTTDAYTDQWLARLKTCIDYMLKASILNTRGKLIGIGKQRNRLLCEHIL